MTDVLHLDFETRSELDLEVCGLDNYVRHPSTQVLMLAWAVNEQKVRLWEPHKGSLPAEVDEALDDPFVEKHAWNSPFERLVFQYVLKRIIPYQEWHDPMINARYLSMPGSLESVGEILQLTSATAKITDGSRLIKLFCEPAMEGGKPSLFGTTVAAFNDWNTHPEDWEKFCYYCKQDVVAERTIANKMANFPLPPQEERLWHLDQRINDAGMPVDMKLVNGASIVASREQARLWAELKEMTGLENPNSNPQMLAWAREQGYPFNAMGKALVARALGGEGDMTPLCKEALQVRKIAAKSSVQKLDVIKNLTSSDGRIRHQFAFMGAARTARWASKGANLQNLPRPDKQTEKNMERAIALLRAEDLDALRKEFTSVLDTAVSCVRPAFRAPDGYKLVVCDLNAVESRVVSWEAQCQSLLKVFHDDRDPYLAFASELYGESYDDLLAEYKAGNKEKRNNAKPGLLGCCYQLGGGEELINEDGDLVKTGLLGYADAMGVKITQDEANRAVAVYREAYPEVTQMWYDLEKASIRAVRSGKPQAVGVLTFEPVGTKMLRMHLPSGRALHYVRPTIEKRELPGKNGTTYSKDVLLYEGIEQQTRQWVQIATRGGHLTENATQAIARDLLAHGMTEADRIGLPIIGHVHDEIIALVPEDSPLGLADLQRCMVKQPSWAPDLPLGAEGYESQYYRKG